MRHPHAELLMEAALKHDAEFIAIDKDGYTKGNIDSVILYPKLEWKSYEKYLESLMGM
jgi:hypothetical protein